MNESESIVITQKPAISKIWIVPIVAALIGAWMTFKYLDERGTSITVTMPNAEGITAGKTLIKTRSVPIGMVSGVRLADNLEQVIVSFEIEKPYLKLLKSDSLIWSVQPRISESGVSGFSTILSGVYFELQPGKSDTAAFHYELLDVPPLISQNVEGRRFQLNSRNAEVLSVGAPVIFKGLRVGSVEKAEFDWYTETMNYQVFIEKPNFNLVKDNTLFWVESGIELDLSADGVNLKTGSLSKLLGGSITFGNPERETRGELAKEGKRFILSASFKDALEERYDEFTYYVVTLDQSVRGLRPRAPVEYRGVRIGTVVEVPALLEQDGKPHFITDNSKLIPVLIKIEYARIYRDTTIAREFWESNIDQWVKEGLRFSLQTGSLITGGLFLEIDFHPEEKLEQLETIASYKVIPGSSSGGFSQLSAQMSDFLNKLNSLDMSQTLTNVDVTLAKFTELAAKTEALVKQTSSKNIPGEINQSLKDLQNTLQGFQHGAPVYSDIRRSLKAIEQLSNELQPLTKSLNEHPNILIFDKPPGDDLQPKRGFSNE